MGAEHGVDERRREPGEIRAGRKTWLERWWWPTTLLAVPGGTLGLLVLLGPLLAGVPDSAMIYLLAALTVVGVTQAVGFIGDMILHDRGLKRLKAKGYRQCPRCGYDLAGVELPGACPECGQRAEAAELERIWRVTYGDVQRAESAGSDGEMKPPAGNAGGSE